MEAEKDLRVKRKIFPVSTFGITLAVFALVTTVQMKILGNYIDYRSIRPIEAFGIFGFWCFGSVAFTLLVSWQIRKNLQQPLERFSAAARQVAAGDFSVYLPPRHTPDKADDLDVLFEDFNKMVEELGSIETLKTDFFSDVSHEFKAPLAVISGNAELLRARGGLDPDGQEALGGILDASRRLSDLIQTMLKLNKLEKQAIRPAPVRYDLCAQLCACAVQYEDAWEQKGITFEAALEDSAFAFADPGLMELVWNNLLSNAVKFTPEGGRITLTQSREDGQLAVAVADTGCGMSRETMAHIFDKFYQGDPSHATPGNGLGLALVKRVLELSDAGLSVQSAPGQGSCFTVRLAPAGPPQEGDAV